ncbi:TPA: hypothetical protein ACF58L_000575 [Yersinia enterocolitica]
MKNIDSKEKYETMQFAVATVLSLYCDRIYAISNVNYEDALPFVNDKKSVGYALCVHIKELYDEFDFLKNSRGTGREEIDHIDVYELRAKAIFLHEHFIKDLVMENLEANLNTDEEGPIYWKLKIVNNPL